MAAKKKKAKKAAKKKTAARKQKAAPKKSTKQASKKAAKKKAAAAAAPSEDEVEEEPARVRKPVPKMPARGKGVIRLAVGIEADTAFMLYALEHEKIDLGDRKYEVVRRDQVQLDQDASDATVDVVSISLGLYPEIDDRYMFLPCGGTFGDHRGPILVARSPIRSAEVDGLVVAAPGSHSSAAMTLRLWLPQARFEFKPMPSRAISLVVRANQARAGLVVTEDQFAYKQHGLLPVVDLGQWWGEETEGLPLPLTMCAIRRDVGEEERAAIALDLKRSIAFALGHREEALEYAAQFARKATPEQVDKFVDRYVNDLSLDCGERGRQAIELMYARAQEIGFYPDADIWPEYHGYEDES